MFFDGVHLVEAGYQVYWQSIQGPLLDLLGDPPAQPASTLPAPSPRPAQPTAPPPAELVTIDPTLIPTSIATPKLARANGPASAPGATVDLAGGLVDFPTNSERGVKGYAARSSSSGDS